jgi:hypothetical protein
MLWSTLLKIGNYHLFLKAQILRNLNIRTRGVSSRIPNTSLHVIFLDYDNIDDEKLKEELRFLQEEFQIGNFYVFKTRNEGRHVYCIDALRLRDVKEIVDFSSCDRSFKKAPQINEYRSWVLRYGKKGDRGEPQYLYTIESPYEGKNLQSRGHAKYLMKFGVKIDLKDPYGPEEVEIQEYNTKDKNDRKGSSRDDEKNKDNKDDA